MDSKGPKSDDAPAEPLVSDADPIDPDESAENIKDKGEPFEGNFA